MDWNSSHTMLQFFPVNLYCKHLIAKGQIHTCSIVFTWIIIIEALISAYTTVFNNKPRWTDASEVNTIINACSIVLIRIRRAVIHPWGTTPLIGTFTQKVTGRNYLIICIISCSTCTVILYM